MRIVLLEDNHLQAEVICRHLRENLRLHEEDIPCIKTERDFRKSLAEGAFESFQPDVFVLDVMVRWMDPEPDAEDDRPEDVKDEGYYKAGMRCARLLRDSGCKTPIILFTIVEKLEVQRELEKGGHAIADLVTITKKGDLSELVECLRRAGRSAST